MSLINIKDKEKRRQMFQKKRLFESQSICQTNGSQWKRFKTCDNSSSVESTDPNHDNWSADVIRCGGQSFDFYDKQFLNKLKQLRKELKAFHSTHNSRNSNHNSNHNLDKQKQDLIDRIKAAIKDNNPSNCEDNENSIDSNESDSTQTLTQNCNNYLQTDCQSENESDYQSEEEKDIREYDSSKSLFSQQYIDSLNSTKPYSFCSQEFRFVKPSQLSSSYDSGFGGSPPDSQPFDSQINSQILSESLSMSSNASNRRKFEIVNRHKWSNTNYSLSTGITLKVVPENKVRTQRKRKHQLKFVLEKILQLIKNDVFCTKRDLYYQNVNLFDKSQRVVDEIIDDLASSLRASRQALHITSSTRGLVFGHLIFRNTNGFPTDCLSSPNGINIPNETEKISEMQSNALFVLIIEKDATFQQLIDLKIQNKFPIIMVTGHGYPDMNTRAFVQMLWNRFEIPIFGLVDGDAHGFEILCTFRHGSLALAYESPNLVAPVIQWLGVLPTDIIDYELSPSVQIDLNERDRKKIQDLKKRVYMLGNHEWNKQLDILLRIGKKVEIQSLAEHWPTFLLDVYLPAKIRYGKWI